VLDTSQFYFAADRSFNVGALSSGTPRSTPDEDGHGGVGAMGTVNVVPQSLQAAYGSRAPLGLFLFVRLRLLGVAVQT